MTTYKKQLKLAKSLGCKNVVEAFSKFGKYEFIKMVNGGYVPKSNRIGNENRLKTIRIVAKNQNPIKNTYVRKMPCLSSENYTIYNDGRVWSNWFGGKFLKPYRIKGYAVIGIQGKRHQVGRLVAFHFKKHEYKRIEDMPPILYIDNNKSNFNQENLKFSEKGELVRKAFKNFPLKNTVIPASKKNLKIIREAVLLKTPYSIIAKKFKCSDMSVHRFLVRNNLPLNSN